MEAMGQMSASLLPYSPSRFFLSLIPAFCAQRHGLIGREESGLRTPVGYQLQLLRARHQMGEREFPVLVPSQQGHLE